MTATESAQEKIDTLRGKVDDLGTALETLRTDIEAKRQTAAEAMLENKNTEAVEANLLRQESRFRTLEAAKKAAEAALPAAEQELVAAKRTDGEKRLKEIRTETDQAASVLEIELRRVSESAKRFEGLLKEAWKISSETKIALSPLGTWVSVGPNCYLSGVISGHADWLSQTRPKDGT